MSTMNEFHGAACAWCGDEMDDSISNLQPTWSDALDGVACNWCAVHIERDQQAATA